MEPFYTFFFLIIPPPTHEILISQMSVYVLYGYLCLSIKGVTLFRSPNISCAPSEELLIIHVLDKSLGGTSGLL